MDIEEVLTRLGIKKWHNLGYKGQGVKVMSGERVFEEDFPNVISPEGFETKSSNDHGNIVLKTLVKVCPEATLYANFLTEKCLQYVYENDITLFGTSSGFDGKIPEWREVGMQKCIDNGTTFIAAAGNKSDEGLTSFATSDKFLAIGAVEYKKGKYIRASYSAIGSTLDYVTIPDWMWTSLGQPIFTGMCVLAQQFFKEKLGRYLNRNELIKFIDDNCLDLHEKGCDEETGKGLFILPDPTSIDVRKYGGDSMTLLLTINSNKVLVNGIEKEVSFAPFLKENRTFVPIRVLEELGFNVEWIESTRQVKLTS